ncbi:MAG: hypothetical protein JW716_00900 [Candidatus Aenigmarchaeota archaeon]|nr:hypothetical protein [Candidatus Aenigmarchaeota archaeon]
MLSKPRIFGRKYVRGLGGDTMDYMSDWKMADPVCMLLYGRSEMPVFFLLGNIENLKKLESIEEAFGKHFTPHHINAVNLYRRPYNGVSRSELLNCGKIAYVYKDNDWLIEPVNSRFFRFARNLAAFNVKKAAENNQSPGFNQGVRHGTLVLASRITECKPDIGSNLYSEERISRLSKTGIFGYPGIYDLCPLIKKKLIKPSRPDNIGRRQYEISQEAMKFMGNCYTRIWGRMSFDKRILEEMEYVYESYRRNPDKFIADSKTAISSPIKFVHK